MSTEKKEIIQYSEPIFRYALKILRNTSDARDCTQEVLLKLWNNRTKFEKHPNKSAFVFLTTKNECLNFLRKSSKTAEVDATELEFKVEENSNAKEGARIIKELIEKMESPQKEVIRMRDVEGYSFEEIAAKLGLEVNNVRVILSRTRKLIREELQRLNDYERIETS